MFELQTYETFLTGHDITQVDQCVVPEKKHPVSSSLANSAEVRFRGVVTEASTPPPSDCSVSRPWFVKAFHVLVHVNVKKLLWLLHHGSYVFLRFHVTRLVYPLPGLGKAPSL